MNIISKSIGLSGGVTRLSKSVGVSAPTVSQWASGARPVPPGKAVSIARATNWQVTPHDLRPDIYPNPTDALPPELTKGEAA